MKTNEEYRLLEQQLAAKAERSWLQIDNQAKTITELEKQNVLLRDALQHNLNAPGDPDAVDDGFAALDATADLAGLVVCDAVPVAWSYKGDELWFTATPEEQTTATPLYARRKEK